MTKLFFAVCFSCNPFLQLLKLGIQVYFPTPFGQLASKSTYPKRVSSLRQHDLGIPSETQHCISIGKPSQIKVPCRIMLLFCFFCPFTSKLSWLINIYISLRIDTLTHWPLAGSIRVVKQCNSFLLTISQYSPSTHTPLPQRVLVLLKGTNNVAHPPPLVLPWRSGSISVFSAECLTVGGSTASQTDALGFCTKLQFQHNFLMISPAFQPCISRECASQPSKKNNTGCVLI